MKCKRILLSHGLAWLAALGLLAACSSGRSSDADDGGVDSGADSPALVWGTGEWGRSRWSGSEG